jgi:ribosome-binding ATPase YchF (GTP1/OBG family)
MVALRSFSFWTLRPELVVLNTAEGDTPPVEEFRTASGLKDPVISICGKLEAEMLELPPEEQSDFLEALGLTEPAFTPSPGRLRDARPVPVLHRRRGRV